MILGRLGTPKLALIVNRVIFIGKKFLLNLDYMISTATSNIK